MRTGHFKDRIDGLLALGNRELSTTLGALARIDGNNYELVAVQSNSGVFVPGEKYTLGDSYCGEVFKQQRTVAASTYDTSPLELHHPLYQSLPLECYIGAPISLDGLPWGCLDFSNMAQCDDRWEDHEIDLVESLASEISKLIGSIKQAS